MKIHEYQAKDIFRAYRLPVPRGGVAATSQEARAVAESLGAARFAVKAQIHAGGRGKGTMKEDPSIHGVAVVSSADEVEEAAGKILGKTLVTKQTGEAGRLVQKVLVEEASEIERELYVGMGIDRASESPVMIASAEGGMSIEELAKEKPEAEILRVMLIKADWRVESITEFSDTSRTKLRHRTTHWLPAQVAAKIGDDVLLYTVHIAKNEQRDGFGPLYGNTEPYPHRMLERNLP